MLHEGINENADSLYFSAPVEIDGNDNLVTVLVHRDVNTKRMYLHSVTTKENLLRQRVSRANAEASKRTSSTEQGGISNIVRDLLTFKPDGASQSIDANGEPLIVEQDGRRVFQNTVTGETRQAEPDEAVAPDGKAWSLSRDEFAQRVSEASGGRWAPGIYSRDGEREYLMPDAKNGQSFEIDGVTFQWSLYTGGKIKGRSMSNASPYLVVRADSQEIGRFSFGRQEDGDRKAAVSALGVMQKHLKRLHDGLPPITFDSAAIPAADTFRLIVEGARLFAALDENAPGFFADLERLREMLMMPDMMSGQLHSEDSLHSEELAALAGDIRPVDLGEPHNRARDEVVEKGRASGCEHGVAILPDGTAVSFGGEYEHRLDIFRFDAPEGSVTVHHNHSKGDSLSRADLRILLEYSELSRIDAHGHKGGWSSCQRICRPLPKQSAILLVEDAAIRAQSLVRQAQKRGLITENMARMGLWQIVIALLLERDGLIRYDFNSDSTLTLARKVLT